MTIDLSIATQRERERERRTQLKNHQTVGEGEMDRKEGGKSEMRGWMGDRIEEKTCHQAKFPVVGVDTNRLRCSKCTSISLPTKFSYPFLFSDVPFNQKPSCVARLTSV
jgi:hypothetical protein